MFQSHISRLVVVSAVLAIIVCVSSIPDTSAQPSNTELAIRALMRAGWPRWLKLVSEVERGIEDIHAACPQFPKSAISTALGSKYNTSWRRIEAEAAQSGMTIQEYALYILRIVHRSVVDDLYRTNCR